MKRTKTPRQKLGGTGDQERRIERVLKALLMNPEKLEQWISEGEQTARRRLNKVE
jgi:hypothetical protein